MHVSILFLPTPLKIKLWFSFYSRMVGWCSRACLSSLFWCSILCMFCRACHLLLQVTWKERELSECVLGERGRERKLTGRQKSREFNRHGNGFREVIFTPEYLTEGRASFPWVVSKGFVFFFLQSLRQAGLIWKGLRPLLSLGMKDSQSS